MVSSEQALKELGLDEHQLRFTCRVHLQDPHSDNDTLHRIYTHLKRCCWGGRRNLLSYWQVGSLRFSSCVFSVLKGYTIQHLPDGTVMVESIVVKVSSSAEDASMKVLLLSWSYQVKNSCFLIDDLLLASFGMVSFSCCHWRALFTPLIFTFLAKMILLVFRDFTLGEAEGCSSKQVRHTPTHTRRGLQCESGAFNCDTEMKVNVK